jgi:hypothetical protein
VGGGGLERDFAFPHELGEFGEAFGNLLDEGDDHRNQPRREHPAGGVFLDGLAEPETELGQFLGGGCGCAIHGSRVSMIDDTMQEKPVCVR